MASLKKAIEQKCKDCTYDSACPGTWREQVEACTVKRCALWEVRPVSVNTVNLRRALASTMDAQQVTAGVDLDSLVDGLEDEAEAA